MCVCVAFPFQHSLEQFSIRELVAQNMPAERVYHTFEHSAATFLHDRYIGFQTGASYSEASVISVDIA